MDENEWNFSSLVKITKKGKRYDPSIATMCLWEYGRECESLRKQIDFLRLAVREHYRVDDEAEIASRAYALTGRKAYVGLPPHPQKDFEPGFLELLNEIDPAINELNQIAGRYNWGIFCSHDFPDKPWLAKGSTCAIRREHNVWDEAAIPGGTILNKVSKRKPRDSDGDFVSEMVSAGPYLPYVSHSVLDLIVCADSTVIAERLEDELADFSGSAMPGDTVPVHIFAFRDQCLDLYDKKHILAAFKKHLDRIERRKFSRRDLLGGKPTRDRCWEWLHKLGIMRLLNGTTKKEVTQLMEAGDDHTVEQIRLLDVSSFSDFRREVPRTFKQLFNVRVGESPLHWAPHPSRAADFV